jgi:ribosomal protein S18 acetylase RimI-like enzyme
LFPQDVAAIKNHYLGLNIDDRRLRFFREANDGQIAGYADGIDWKRSLLVGAVQHDRIIGMAEAGFDDHDPPRHAEVAVSVDAAVRGRGLGRCLARRAVEHAAALGAQATCFLFLRENRPVQRLVRSLGGRLDMEALSGIITLGGAGSGRVAFGKPVPV